MALNRVIAEFLAHGLAAGAIPAGGDLLEIGESIIVNYDTPDELLDQIRQHIPPERFAEARRRVAAAVKNKAVYQNAFGPARAFFHAVFEPRFYMAVELGLSPRRLCIDLNEKQSVGRRFDCVVNNGSSEHIFDQAKVFGFIHEATRPGGTMIHWTPGLGFANHGLYNIQPGFFFDLAHANDYELKVAGLASREVFKQINNGEDYRRALHEHSSLRESMLCAILQKKTDSSFKNPIQSDYQGGLPASYRVAKVPRRYTIDGRTNLALEKPATQSSTSRYSFDGDPDLDASGGNNGIITGYYSFHTGQEVEPWWVVDLGEETPLREIVIYNLLLEAGEMAKRASRLRVKLSQDGRTWTTVFARTDNTPIGGADGNPLRVSVNGHTARFVRVDLPGLAVLHLDEIEVY